MATRNYNPNLKDTPISLAADNYTSNNEDREKIYYCNSCQRKLMRISDTEWICTHDNISHYPESDQVRRKSRLVTPDGPIEEPCVSYTPDPIHGKQPVEIKGTFKALQQKGIRIKDYKETDGAGREIR